MKMRSEKQVEYETLWATTNELGLRRVVSSEQHKLTPLSNCYCARLFFRKRTEAEDGAETKAEEHFCSCSNLGKR